MRRRSRRALHILFPLAGISIPAVAQGPLSWEQVLQRSQQNNRVLPAEQTNVEETRANTLHSMIRGFLDAQKSYRDTEPSYRNLIGSYLAAVNQLNLAVGREVL